eukprot:3188182-Rhodomonas_salina.1
MSALSSRTTLVCTWPAAPASINRGIACQTWGLAGGGEEGQESGVRGQGSGVRGQERAATSGIQEAEGIQRGGKSRPPPSSQYPLLSTPSSQSPSI